LATALALETCDDWQDYELLDSGNGRRLERFGPYRFIRPEQQAMWQPAFSAKEWQQADGIFQATNEEMGGHWELRNKVEPEWKMKYRNLKFWAKLTNSRHLGVFPEQAPHWDWISRQVQAAMGSVQVLNLFGYTGLASLCAVQAGARVTHVDASKKSVAWGRENQSLSGLQDRPIRWIIDDALKFVQREKRRGQVYHGIILDPPKFGRGPKGEVWEAFEKLPSLLADCRGVMAEQPKFLVITAYAIRASALSLLNLVQEMLAGLGGSFEAGELAIRERSAGRLLSTAIFVRWRSVSSKKDAGGAE